MQYLISCNTTLRINSFIDKAGHDMAVHGHRYAKYINEKLSSYQLFGVDFTKVKRGREDAMLRTMNIEQLTIMMPVLQNQIDTLLAFKVYLPTKFSSSYSDSADRAVKSNHQMLFHSTVPRSHPSFCLLQRRYH